MVDRADSLLLNLPPLTAYFGTPLSVYIGLRVSFNSPMVFHRTAYYYLNNSPIDGHSGCSEGFTVMTSFTTVKPCMYPSYTCADISLVS